MCIVPVTEVKNLLVYRLPGVYAKILTHKNTTQRSSSSFLTSTWYASYSFSGCIAQKYTIQAPLSWRGKAKGILTHVLILDRKA